MGRRIAEPIKSFFLFFSAVGFLNASLSGSESRAIQGLFLRQQPQELGHPSVYSSLQGDTGNLGGLMGKDREGINKLVSRKDSVRAPRCMLK